MLTDQTPDGISDDDLQRYRVLQALLQQQQKTNQAPNTGALSALSSGLQAYGASQLQQRRAEDRQNAKLGVTPTSPAFDDNGYALPRAPGMVQPSMLDAIQNFFARGTQ